MAYPFKTHQFNIPAEKTEIYTASRQELVFSATVCNQSAETGAISLWTRIGGVESPVEFQRPVPGTNSADNKAIAVALNKINLENGDAILASGGGAVGGATWSDAYQSNWSDAYQSNWSDAYNGGNAGGNTSSSLMTLTISILY